MQKIKNFISIKGLIIGGLIILVAYNNLIPSGYSKDVYTAYTELSAYRGDREPESVRESVTKAMEYSSEVRSSTDVQNPEKDIEGDEDLKSVDFEKRWIAAMKKAHDDISKRQLTYGTPEIPHKTAKTIDCSGYVSYVMELAGMGTNIRYTSHSFYENQWKWQVIWDVGELEPGDIAVMLHNGDDVARYGSAHAVQSKNIGHVQIYAGNNTWYNAGGTRSIRAYEPITYFPKKRFVFALRPAPLNNKK